MNKGILSGAVIVMALFLVTATIVYSRIPLQAQKTTIESEGIKNYLFHVQIAQKFADTAFAEAIHDYYYAANPPKPACNFTLSYSGLKNKFRDYLNPLPAAQPNFKGFGHCRIANASDLSDSPDISASVSDLSSVSPSTPANVTVTSTIAVYCEMPREGTIKKILYRKDFDLSKRFTISSGATRCGMKVEDIPSNFLIDIETTAT
ncbi:MAG: hypothetical protein HYW50_03305 [Candidatus Diapherotrites archaeon]|nr:hypothetical protein [Candidatus Diapherotrites archaeon]